MKRQSGALETVLGIVLLATGVGGLAWAAYYWRTRTAAEEPANPGRTHHPSKRSLSFMNQENMTDEERDRRFQQEMDDLAEEFRRDALIRRFHLFGIVPAGLVMAALGVWLLTTVHRQPGS